MKKLIFALLFSANALAMHVNLPKAASRLAINKVLSRKFNTNFDNLSRKELIQKLVEKCRKHCENMPDEKLIQKLQSVKKIESLSNSNICATCPFMATQAAGGILELIFLL
ncbi:hypothetical protein A3F66_06295 [candidate division TM6 bacterium RIFCSPHIGHO2_12_FULL_32_22]|nr:MAG: hypothetical protein A3F66_06295 [candidate division TM6 bacterium RIFCSPHIGHO2_12_FULL_32_22]